jgi:iron complex outermembrane recepter protein
LGANYTYLDTELRKFLENTPGVPPGFTDLTGNELPLSPTSAYTLSADYRFSAGDAGSFSIGGSYRYKGSHFFELTNPPEGKEPGYGILDGRITYQPGFGGFEVALWIQNASDEVYRSQVQVGARTGISRYGPPRTYGLTLSWQYQ